MGVDSNKRDVVIYFILSDNNIIIIKYYYDASLLCASILNDELPLLSENDEICGNSILYFVWGKVLQGVKDVESKCFSQNIL